MYCAHTRETWQETAGNLKVTNYNGYEGPTILIDVLRDFPLSRQAHASVMCSFILRQFLLVRGC